MLKQWNFLNTLLNALNLCNVIPVILTSSDEDTPILLVLQMSTEVRYVPYQLEHLNESRDQDNIIRKVSHAIGKYSMSCY